MQVSILCPYPYFFAGGELSNNVTVFAGVDPMFQFIFSNESTTENLLKFSEIRTSAEQVITNTGDADVGVTIFIDFIGEAKNITIYNVGTRESLSINTDRLTTLTGSGIVAGDQIVISSVAGDKFITLLRNGVTYNILNVLDRRSTWFTLARGDNIFGFEAEEGAAYMLFRVENRILYEGV
jgi:hypothetical protein